MNLLDWLRWYLAWDTGGKGTTVYHESFVWMCRTCRRLYSTESAARECIVSHPVETPPTNEDR